MLKEWFEQWTPTKITDVQAIEGSKAFCMMPFVHLFVSQFGTVVPCCLTPWHKEQALGNINEQSIEEIWNGAPMRAFRRKMLRDQKDDRCQQCYDNEKVGLRSTRQTYNQLYAHKLDWVQDTSRTGKVRAAKPIYWDIRFSNLCNFRCRICGHHSSSNWFEDAKEIGAVSHDTKVHRGINDFVEVLDQLEMLLPEVEEIYFAGGEPLLMEEHYQLLDLLIRKGKTDMKLRYSTNFSQTSYKGRDVFELWQRFDNIHIHASLDGSDGRGEYQRKGQDWQKTLTNRRRLMETCPHVDFLITATLSIFNIFHLPDFHQDWVSRGLIQIDECMPHTLKQPQIYNLQMLPPSLKERAANKVEAHIQWILDHLKHNPLPEVNHPDKAIWEAWINRNNIEVVTGHIKLDLVINEFRSAVNFMQADDKTHLIPEFRRVTAQLDALRNENFMLEFPELKDLYAV